MRNTSLENLIFTVAPILLDKLEQMDGRTNTTKAKRGRVGSNVKGQKKTESCGGLYSPTILLLFTQ